QDKEWETQRKILLQQNITAIRWDAEEITLLLKDRAGLAFDFFGPEWFRRFFNREPTELRNRLAPHAVMEFRARCRQFYEHVFDQWDPGLPLGRGQESHRLPLA